MASVNRRSKSCKQLSDSISRAREKKVLRVYLLQYSHTNNLFARPKANADWLNAVQVQHITSSHLNVVYQVSPLSRAGDATLSALTLSLNTAGSDQAPVVQSTSQISHIGRQFAKSVEQKAPTSLLSGSLTLWVERADNCRLVLLLGGVLILR